MTRSTKFKPDTYDLLSVFERPGDIPTTPRGLPLLPPPTNTAWLKTGPSRFRLRLRPTWLAVATSGIVGTLAGVLIAVLSAPVVGG